MTRRDFLKPAFSLRKKRSVKTHALSLLGTTRLLSRSEGMGVHGPRIDELAIRKLRTQEPELASEWDDMQEAQRLHQAMQRKQEQEKKQALEHEQLNRGGLRLGLSQTAR